MKNLPVVIDEIRDFANIKIRLDHFLRDLKKERKEWYFKALLREPSYIQENLDLALLQKQIIDLLEERRKIKCTITTEEISMYLFETITAGLLEVIKKELIGLNRPSTEASVDEITEGVWWLSKPPIAQR